MKQIGRAKNQYPGRVQADLIAVLDYSGAGEKHFNIPANATVAVVSSTVAVWLLTNGQTAAVPAADSSSFPSPNTVPELILPYKEYYFSVTAGNLFSCAASAAGLASISFYQDTDLLDVQSAPNINSPP